jgi:anti-sigma regulatory factor (Ser/Thr protein kinase)
MTERRQPPCNFPQIRASSRRTKAEVLKKRVVGGLSLRSTETAAKAVEAAIKHFGKGFERSTVPDPTAPKNRLFIRRRGIYLMKTLMDEVSFEKGGAVARGRKKSNAGPDPQRRSGITSSL